MTLGAITLEEIQVLGTRIVTAVDVKSTESATNVTREELERLPVERDLLSVALLAPGLTKGDGGLCSGGNCGVSFGGSSIAENTVYINGLNVTDFYNRVGFSSVPYAFYKEFQVKTGGYSVEFGRTTGGVINAVTRSGTNEFEFGTRGRLGAEFAAELQDQPLQPRWHAPHHRQLRRVRPHHCHACTRRDRSSRTSCSSSRLYEARDYQPRQHRRRGQHASSARKEDNGFWGAKIDWQINDQHLLELLGVLGQERGGHATASTSTSRRHARRLREHAVHQQRRPATGPSTYTGYFTENLR